jgi:UDP-sulfoquinovose synthase
VRCVQLAIENPPERGDRVRVFNQMTETHRIADLAQLVSEMTGVDIDHLENPRNEADSNELLVDNSQLLKLGLDPITLQQGMLEEVTDIAVKYAGRADLAKIPCRSMWRQKR